MTLAKTIAEYQSEGRSPEILFWVGCAGSFDTRAQRITRTLCEILNHAGVEFAILGSEERCTGDPARRAPAAIARDIVRGYYTEAEAHEKFGRARAAE